MSRSKNRNGNSPTEKNPNFIETGSLSKLNKDDLKKMREPLQPESDDEYVAYYAIGRVNGIIERGPKAVNMSDGASILYISDNGYAYERMFDQSANKWDRIPRVSYSNKCGGKQAKEWMKIHFNKLKRLHKRLDKRRESDVAGV